MKRGLPLLVFLIAAVLTGRPATIQDIEPPVFVGVGKGSHRGMEQLSHLYAIDAAIVNLAAKIGTSTVGRAVVSATTHTYCCPPCRKSCNELLVLLRFHSVLHE